MSSFNHHHFAHLKITLRSIISATNNFAKENVIQETDFGNAYKGQLLWFGELIKIDARRYNKDEWDDEKEQQFWMEISLLSSLKHKNLVSLVGFCDENDEKIIIMKLENYKSLVLYLSDVAALLTWVKRLEICVGLAHALSYIHYDENREFSVIHQNIDSFTVLLNDNWEPKLSEFRLSMKIKASQRHLSFDTNKVSSSDGHTDPTYEKTKSANHKSDMYSFGIVLFELLCGRESIIDSDYNKYLAPVAITHYREKKLHEIIDWDLWKQMDSESFNIFAKTAYDCLNEERSQRPNIDEIVPKLEKALKLACEKRPIMSLPNNEFAHLKVPLESIISATNNFDEENAIRDSIYANDYKGQLLWSGELIDIRAQRFNKERNDREQLFWMEISMLSTLKHKILVSLVGFCDDNDEKVIIYKNETRGTLVNYLSDPMLLTWVRRLEICVGLAHALSYIHYDEPRDFSVIHRHISSGTVLLNDGWEPKLCEFEDSIKIKASQRHHSFHTNRVKGVNGYADPTYLETNRVSHKSDMYSFGIVLFELVCGRTSIINSDTNKYLAPLAVTHYREKRLDEIIDWDLWKQMDSHSLDIFTKTAYDCVNEERSQRPNIDEVVTRLEKALELQLKHQKVTYSPTSRKYRWPPQFETFIALVLPAREHECNGN
ncbi:kinase-like domain, phloem protein 2-like protein [Tanacetum coccineum]